MIIIMMVTMMMVMMIIMTMIIITTTIIIIIIIIIIIELKGAVRVCFFFYNLLTAPRTVSNTYAQAARAQSCANHVQYIERLSRAARVTCQIVGRSSSAVQFDRVEIALFQLFFFFFWLNHQPMKEGRNRSTRRKPLATSFRKCS